MRLARFPRRQEGAMDPRIFLLVVIALAALWVAYRVFEGLRSFRVFGRGKRLVTCPETKEVVAVETDGRHIALTSAIGVTELQLKRCSRWPERQDCGQECLAQIEIAPHDCLVRSVVDRWYADKNCVYCGKAIGKVDWANHQPALMDHNRATVQWNEVPPERIPELLARCWPVCWNCHISESFRRAFPSMVIERNRGNGAKQEVAAEK
jgi:hypothetical protein